MSDHLDQAIALAAAEWRKSADEGSVPQNINLQDQCRIFARNFLPKLWAKIPPLRSANDQVRLLIIAEGLAQSLLVDRVRVERELGIILPPA